MLLRRGYGAWHICGPRAPHLGSRPVCGRGDSLPQPALRSCSRHTLGRIAGDSLWTDWEFEGNRPSFCTKPGVLGRAGVASSTLPVSRPVPGHGLPCPCAARLHRQRSTREAQTAADQRAALKCHSNLRRLGWLHRYRDAAWTRRPTRSGDPWARRSSRGEPRGYAEKNP